MGLKKVEALVYRATLKTCVGLNKYKQKTIEMLSWRKRGEDNSVYDNMDMQNIDGYVMVGLTNTTTSTALVGYLLKAVTCPWN